MSKLRVSCFSVSVDGYAAGPNQDLENPLGVGGMSLHQWLYPTRTFQAMVGEAQGTTGVDDEFAARGNANVGAWILGRNMFGPVRGPWPEQEWKGWWGDDPPFHVPVYVVTHHARAPLKMAGGTTFHFVTGGIHEALQQAQQAAAGKDVRVGGGANLIRQYLRAGLLDEVHLAVAPVLLGAGEALFSDLSLPALGYRVLEHVATAAVTHVVLGRDAAPQ